jgi:hypothetical protein
VFTCVGGAGATSHLNKGSEIEPDEHSRRACHIRTEFEGVSGCVPQRTLHLFIYNHPLCGVRKGNFER